MKLMEVVLKYFVPKKIASLNPKKRKIIKVLSDEKKLV